MKDTKSPKSDGEVRSDDSPSNQGILHMVLGYSNDDTKEAALRQKLLEKKAQITEANLRKKLMEKRVQNKEEEKSKSPSRVESRSPSPSTHKKKKRRSSSRSMSPKRSRSPAKRKRKRKRSRSTSSSSSESTPPKRKKKASRHKKSKKKSKKPVDHMKNLAEKSVLNRVVLRHLNPKEPEKPRKSNRKNKDHRRNASGNESERTRRNRRYSRSPRRSRSPLKNTLKRVETTEQETIVVEEDSPVPSPKILLYQQCMQAEFEPPFNDNFEEGSVEAKPFEDLTDEEKAMLSPTLLTFKENIYQKQLISSLPIYYPGISGCRSVDEFQILNRIEEGTFGVVYRALELRTDEIVALKRLKMEKEKEGFPITSLREINMLMKCRKHPNVVNIKEIVVGSTMDKIFLVMEYVDHDMKVLLKQMDERKKKFRIAEVKTLLHQLLSGTAYLHEEWVIHRDLKTSNLLLTSNNILKIGDFGLAREYGDPLKQYTPVVVTLWYRSPELLLGCSKYSTAVDVWSIGCIFGEFLKLRPIFQGSTEMDQLNKIFMDTGTPNKTVWPAFDELPGISRVVFANTPYNQLRKKFMTELKSEAGLDLLNKLLALDPSRRVSAETALKHRFFFEEPQPASLDSFQTFPSKSESNKALTRLNLPAVSDKSGILPLDKNKQQLIEELEIDTNALAKNGFSLNLGIKK